MTAVAPTTSRWVPRALVGPWMWVRRRTAHVPRTAALLAFLGMLASDTPSLMPRPWYFQGFIAGITGVVFYAVGVLIEDVARWAGLSVRVNARARRLLKIVGVVLLVLAAIVYPALDLIWHALVNQYFGEPPPGPMYPVLSLVVALAVIVVFVSLFRLVSALITWVTSRTERRVPREALAKVIATVATLLVLAAVMDQVVVVVRGLLLVAKQQADAVNAEQPAGLTAPTEPTRSGGPGSLVPWGSIGADGSSFIASGPTAAEIASATGARAVEPIRIFAPIADGRSEQQTLDLVLAEMDRTRAWDRRAVLVLTSTSTGFVNEWAAESFEYLLGGDTAIVTMQYSTLPSALALITARDQPPRVGRLLFDGVSARRDALPAASRPRLYVGGESLGAYGGNGAFASATDMLAKVDGALWTGTPSFTPIQAELTRDRTYGSTVANPVVDDGRHIRFAGDPGQLTRDQFGHLLGPWDAPRVVYLQHDTDPVVWWSTDLLFQTPGWLDEPGPPGTTMSLMSWMPVVTFWQLTADMAMSNSFAGGSGHRYQEGETVPAWAGVLGLSPTADYSRIQAAIKKAHSS